MFKSLDPLPEARAQAAAVFARNRLYVLGGEITTGPTYPLTVWSASVSAGNEDLSKTWDSTVAVALPAAGRGMAAIFDDDEGRHAPDSQGGPGRFYVSGGTDDSAADADVALGVQVLLAKLAGDGTITAWLPQSPLPIALNNHAMFTNRGFLYAAGGQTQTVTLAYTAGADTVLTFHLGTVAFTPGDVLTGGTSGATGTIVSVVVTSGTFGAGTAAGHITLASVTGTYSAAETITDTGGGSATALAGQTVVAPAAGDTITGATSGKTATIVSITTTSGTFAAGTAAGVITISGATGTFTAAETLNDSTGAAFTNTAAQALTQTASAAIFRARIGADGSLGNWTQLLQPLPAALAYAQVATSRDFVFVYDGTNLFTARLDVDGTIVPAPGFGVDAADAPFVKTVLPGVRNHAEIAVVQNKLVIIGGYDGGNTESQDFQVLILNGDGSQADQRAPATNALIGVTKSDFALAVDYQQLPARVFCLGGSSSHILTGVADVEAGAIQRDGSV